MLPVRGQNLARTLRRSTKTASRNYAAASVPLTDPLDDSPSGRARNQYPEGEVKITQLENGVKVATIDNGGSVSRLTVALDHGSRHETTSKLGLSHVFKNAAFLTNKDRTSLRTVREMQQAGVSLESSVTREMLLRKAVFLRSKLPEVLENIGPGISQPLFNSWDIAEVKDACRAENARLEQDDTAVNFELMHQLAYRTNLGNSLYCHNLKLGSHSTAKFEEFAEELYVGEKLSVIGYDISHDDLLRHTQEHFGLLSKGGKVSSSPQKYHGGEGRQFTSNSLTYASLVAQGAGLFHESLATFVVLSKLLGDGQYIKWGSNQISRLSKAGSAVTGGGPFMIRALNMNYSDNGLFGFHAIAEPEAITGVLKSAVNSISSLSKGDVTDGDITRAKNQAKAAVYMHSENTDDFHDDMVKQVVLRGGYTPIQEFIAKIDNVTADNLLKAAKNLLSEKGVLSLTGDVSSAPYLDQLVN